MPSNPPAPRTAAAVASAATLRVAALSALLTTLPVWPLSAAPSKPAAPALDLEARMVQVQDGALSALVNIQPITESFTGGETRKESSVGSGFLIDDKGHVVTNYHVAGRARRLLVTLSNKERVEAEIVGEDPLTDLAVIRLPEGAVREHGLRPLPFGTSEDLRVGQWVLALGSPLALARTMTAGIVSNTDRYLPEGMSLPSGERTGEFNTWIQTDAAINPGNSGGPLIDLQGRVVGVNARGAVMADNIGFAIPGDTVRAVVDALIRDGEVKRSWSGLRLQPLKDWEGLFGMDESRGVLVASVVPSSPADVAGLHAGDVILRWGGEDLDVRYDEEVPAIYRRIADAAVGAKIDLVVRRGGSEVPLSMTTRLWGRLSGDRFEAETWGFTVKGITENMRWEMELDSTEGVLIEGVRTGGPAQQGGLWRGAVLQAIEGERVADLDAFKARYAAAEAGKAVLLTVRAGDTSRYVLVQGGARAEVRP